MVLDFDVQDWSVGRHYDAAHEFAKHLDGLGSRTGRKVRPKIVEGCQVAVEGGRVDLHYVLVRACFGQSLLGRARLVQEAPDGGLSLRPVSDPVDVKLLRPLESRSRACDSLLERGPVPTLASGTAARTTRGSSAAEALASASRRAAGPRFSFSERA